jgi:hypothetical protein
LSLCQRISDGGMNAIIVKQTDSFLIYAPESVATEEQA